MVEVPGAAVQQDYPRALAHLVPVRHERRALDVEPELRPVCVDLHRPRCYAVGDVVNRAQRRDERAPESVWRLWVDVPGWPEWNADLAQAELDGDFGEGSTIRMTSNDSDVVELRIAEAVEPERFVDEAELGGITVRTTHRLEPAGPERVRIVYRMEITGPDADTVGAEVGPQISGDFPEVLEALARRAER